jgi:hypothetical protein
MLKATFDLKSLQKNDHCFALKPINDAIEHYLIGKVVKRKKRNLGDDEIYGKGNIVGVGFHR